jgi:hypothetical protein
VGAAHHTAALVVERDTGRHQHHHHRNKTEANGFSTTSAPLPVVAPRTSLMPTTDG